MKKLKGLILVFLAIVLVSTFTYTIADVGNFESYGSDWGSSSSWGSDWSSNSSLDYDWGASSSSNRNHKEFSGKDYVNAFLYIAKCICFWVASYFMARLFLTILPIINEKKNRLKSFLNYEKKSGKKEITKMIMKIVKMIAKVMIIFFVVISYSHGRIDGKSITGVLVAMNAIWLIAIGMSWLGILNCRIFFMILFMIVFITGFLSPLYVNFENFGDFVISFILAIITLVICNEVGMLGISPFHSQKYMNNRYIRNEGRSKSVVNKVKDADKQFNDEQFLMRAKDIFIKLQMAWSERNWEVIRTFETEDLFELHSKQLREYVTKKQINKMEKIHVNFVEFVSFKQDNEKDILSVALNSSMVDYIIDEASKKVLKGDKRKILTNTYKLTFIRKKGVLTAEADKLETKNCPNCGAPIAIASTGKCEFCGSVITTGSHGWLLGDMERY